MNEFEKEFLQVLVDNEDAQGIILEHNRNINFYNNDKTVLEKKKITSDVIFELMLEVMSREQQREYHEHGALNMHYRYDNQVFTIDMFYNDGLNTVFVKKGKNDLFPHTDIILPEVKMGDRYRLKGSTNDESWIVVGNDGNEVIQFYIEEEGI